MNKEYEQFVWDPEVDQNYDTEVYGYNNVVKNGLYNGIYKSKCAFTTKANSQRNRLFDLKIIESEAPLSNQWGGAYDEYSIEVVNGNVTFDYAGTNEEGITFLGYGRVDHSTGYMEPQYHIEGGSLTIKNLGGWGESEGPWQTTISNGSLIFENVKGVALNCSDFQIKNLKPAHTDQIENGLRIVGAQWAALFKVYSNSSKIEIDVSGEFTLNNSSPFGVGTIPSQLNLVGSIATIRASSMTLRGAIIISQATEATLTANKIKPSDLLLDIHDNSTIAFHSDSGCPIDFSGDNKPVQGFINFISSGYVGGSVTISGMNKDRLQALQNGGFVAIDGKPLDANEFLAYVDCTLEPNVTISIKQMPSKVPAISGPYPLPVNQFPQINSLAVFPNQGYYIPNGQALEGSSTNFAIAVVKNFQPGPTPKVIEFPVTDNNAIGVMCGNPELSVSFNGSFPKNLSQDYKGQITYSTLFNQGFSSPTPINGLPYQYKTYYFDAQYDAFNDTVFFAGRQGDREGLIFSLVNAGQKEFITTITMPDNTNWNVEDSSFGVSSNPRRIYFCGENAVTYCDIDKGNLIGSVSVPKVDGKQATALTYICVDNANGVVYVSALYGEGGQQETVIHKFSAVTNDYIGIVIRQQGLFSNMLVDDTGTYLYSAGGLRINVIETNGSFVANTIMLDKQADGEEIAAMGWDRLSLTLVVGISDYSSAGTPTPSRVYMINKPYNAA